MSYWSHKINPLPNNYMFNQLLDDKVLEQSELKQITDDILKCI